MRLEEIMEAGPHPLGERVQHLQANGEGDNACVIARRIALEEADPADLPPIIRALFGSINRHDEGKSKDRARANEYIREYTHLGSLKSGRPLALRKCEALIDYLSICKQDIAEFPTSLDSTDISTSDGWNVALNRANSVCIAERLIKILPRKIEQANDELKAIDAEIAALEAKFK